jgi:hypothetical protein
LENQKFRDVFPKQQKQSIMLSLTSWVPRNASRNREVTPNYSFFGGKKVPVQDFALDAQNNRIQVHWSFEDGPVSVMLNRSVICTLAVAEDRSIGKDFTLPDNSILHVQFYGNQPQVFRNGYPLTPVEQAATEPMAVKKRGGCLTTWIILNLVAISIFTLTYFLAVFGASLSPATGISPVIFLIYGLLGCVGIFGLAMLLAWKKWGFYLIALYVVANIPLAFAFGLVNYETFTPLIGLAVLYYLLRRNQVWEHLA